MHTLLHTVSQLVVCNDSGVEVVGTTGKHVFANHSASLTLRKKQGLGWNVATQDDALCGQ